MSCYDWMAHSILAPAVDGLRRTHTMRHLNYLNESQWWTEERLLDLQTNRLQRLIEHAYATVTYYRQLMDERGLTPRDLTTAEDLSKLPVLTRQMVHDSADAMVSRGVPRHTLRPMLTSGSTGEPLAFYSTKDDQFTYGMARTLRALSWAGLGVADPIAQIGRPRHYRNRVDQALHLLSLAARRVKVIDSSILSDSTLPTIAQILCNDRYVGVFGSPPVLSFIGGYIRSTGICISDAAKVVVSVGEQLLPHERTLLRDVFGSEPFSKYSSFEVYDIASECPAHDGLHVQAEDVIVEVVDENGQRATDGSLGQLVVTNLHNYAMPLIRYEIGDLSAIRHDRCSCGRWLPRLVNMVGRMSELIVTPSGRRVFGADLGLDAFDALGVRQFRIEQDGEGKVVAQLEWRSTTSEDQRAAGEERVAQALRMAIGENVPVSARTVDRLMPHPSGKHLVISSRLASRLASRASGDGKETL